MRTTAPHGRERPLTWGPCCTFCPRHGIRGGYGETAQTTNAANARRRIVPYRAEHNHGGRVADSVVTAGGDVAHRHIVRVSRTTRVARRYATTGVASAGGRRCKAGGHNQRAAFSRVRAIETTTSGERSYRVVEVSIASCQTRGSRPAGCNAVLGRFIGLPRHGRPAANVVGSSQDGCGNGRNGHDAARCAANGGTHSANIHTRTLVVPACGSVAGSQRLPSDTGHVASHCKIGAGR